jgi:hypothetical protein
VVFLIALLVLVALVSNVIAGEKIAQGREKVKAYLETNPEVMDELEKEIRAKMMQAAGDVTSTAALDVDIAASADSEEWEDEAPMPVVTGAK